MALWLASLESGKGPELVAVPSGLLARGAFAWRPGDVFLAVSSSGEFRDLVEAVDGGAPAPYGAVTANAGSTLGARAGARALVSVPSQRAVTHTQAFCGAVVAALRMWAAVTATTTSTRRSAVCPDELEHTIGHARAWVDDIGPIDPETAVVFGGGPGWAAALEAALLLKEVALVPAEGVETREGATSAMMALAARSARAEPAGRRRRRSAPRGGRGDLRGSGCDGAPRARRRDDRPQARGGLDVPRRRRAGRSHRPRARPRRRPARMDRRVLPGRETGG